MSEMMFVKSVEVLAAEINAIKVQTRTVVLSSSIEIGRRLVEAKALVPHGQWGVWLEDNVEYSERTAQNLMRVSEEYGNSSNPQTFADLSYSKAIAMLGLSPETRDELMETRDIESMSTRELQEEIDRLRAEDARKQAAIDEMTEELKQDDEAAAAVIEDLNIQKKKIEQELEAARDREADAMAEAQRARDELEAAKGEGKKGNAESEKLKDAKLKLKEAELAQKSLNQQIGDLEAKLKEAENHVTIQEVEKEVIPPEVEEELKRLRHIEEKAPCEEIVLLRASYERLVTEFQVVSEMLEKASVVMPEEAGKYRVAISAAVEKMGVRIVGETEGGE